MNVSTLPAPRRFAAVSLMITACMVWPLAACHKAPAGADEPAAKDAPGKAGAAKGGAAGGDTPAEADAPAKGGAAAADSKDKAAEDAGEGVALKTDEIEKMGIVTTAAAAATHTPETGGFGVVVAHETIAQAVADLATAIAVERQSRSAFARGQRLAGTPGAMPADTQEAAQRQLTVDAAALELTKRKLTSTFGQNPPWKDHYDSPELKALASGEIKLVRVTFPFGALGGTKPETLRLAQINAAPGTKSWHSNAVWSAPADATFPGKSFFALLKSADPGEGERLLAWAPVGEAESGAEVPAAAALISSGKYWCYVEEKPGVFVRTPLDTSMPTDAGYFVKEGVSPDDKVVTASAGELLARELNPSTAAE